MAGPDRLCKLILVEELLIVLALEESKIASPKLCKACQCQYRPMSHEASASDLPWDLPCP